MGDVGEGVRDAGAELSRRVGGRGRVKKCHDLGLMTMTKEFNGYEFDDGADDDDDGERVRPNPLSEFQPVQNFLTVLRLHYYSLFLFSTITKRLARTV